MLIDAIKLDFETREKILRIIPKVPGEPEMTPFESAFLCGLLRTVQPRKILEIGVSAGGTTAIVLQCLEDLGYSYEMHSVDICEKWCLDEREETGFMARCAKSVLHTGFHQFHLGAGVTKYLDEIGDKIDFAILDTTHALPGEVLDFLVILPFLRDGAVVCLHDISFCQTYETPQYNACGVLFQTVSADKWLNFTPSGHYPNIAAFRVTSETRTRIADVFSALILRWLYIPSEDEMRRYCTYIQKIYGNEAYYKIFNEAVRMNELNLNFQQNVKGLSESLPKNSRVLLYGAGNRGKSIYAEMKKAISVIGWIDQRKGISMLDGLPIYSVDEIPDDGYDFIIVTPERLDVTEEIRRSLRNVGVKEEKVLSLEGYGRD